MHILAWILLVASYALYPFLLELVVQYHTIGIGLHYSVGAAIAVLWAILQFIASTWVDEMEAAAELRHHHHLR